MTMIRRELPRSSSATEITKVTEITKARRSRRNAPAAVFLTLAAVLCCARAAKTVQSRIQFSDLPPSIQRSFGIRESDFAEYLLHVDIETERRLADGEREHFVYYALQSSRFTDRPPIEPAVSARRFVESLAAPDRTRFLAERDYVPARGWPPAERLRILDALRATAEPGRVAYRSESRLLYFKQLLASEHERFRGQSLLDVFYADYVRIARFLFKKEFEPQSAAGVAELYRTRPHSTDTQLEAGFGVYLALGAMHALEPDHRIARVLIVGPGLDLAPRTDLIDVVPPQMYQPFAVADALLAQSISDEGTLHIESVDVNPRVVEFANQAASLPVTLHLMTGVQETRERPLSADYRDYVSRLGHAIGIPVSPPPGLSADKRYRRSIAIRRTVTRSTAAERLNIVTERLMDRPQFDLVIITNVLTYFDDRQLALALSNIAAMIVPAGYLIHNEARAGLVETAARLRLPTVHMRTAVLGGPPSRPWYDTVWLHRKTRS
jgi:hypothetical protein